MRVYHFRSSKRGLESIADKRLKVAGIMGLNDPFECFGMRFDERKFRDDMRELKKDISKTKGILCFSKSWKSPVQWAHYAKNHTGICLELDVPRKLLNKILYVKSRIRHIGIIDSSMREKMLTTKFKHWAYEKEYRQILELDQLQKVGEHYFASFSVDLVLKRVIVGCESDISRNDVNSALSSIKSVVEVFKARPAFRTFRIIKNKKENLWL